MRCRKSSDGFRSDVGRKFVGEKLKLIEQIFPFAVGCKNSVFCCEILSFLIERIFFGEDRATWKDSFNLFSSTHSRAEKDFRFIDFLQLFFFFFSRSRILFAPKKNRLFCSFQLSLCTIFLLSFFLDFFDFIPIFRGSFSEHAKVLSCFKLL